MKKAVIAGAASAVLAAMPVVGAFAATSVYDIINVTVTDQCTFNRTAGEGTYGVTMLANAINEGFGSSTFTATCNFADQSQPGAEGSDIQVTAAFTSLVSGANEIAYSGSALTAGTAGWNASKGDRLADATVMANNSDLINVSDVFANQSATVWYSVATASNQAAGTYTGTATYTLAEN